MSHSKRHGLRSDSKEDDDDNNNDRLSTSSVESEDRILLPSKHVLEEIEKAKKQQKKSVQKKVDKRSEGNKTYKRDTEKDFRSGKHKVKSPVILDPVPKEMKKRNSAVLQCKKKKIRSKKYKGESQVNLESCASKKTETNSLKAAALHMRNFKHRKSQVISEPSAPKKTRNNSSKTAISQIKSYMLFNKQNVKNSCNKAKNCDVIHESALKRTPKKLMTEMITDTCSLNSACSKETKNITQTFKEGSSNFKLSTSSNMPENNSVRDEENCPNSSVSKVLECDRSEKFKHVIKDNFQLSQVSNISQSMIDPQTSTSVNIPESHDETFKNISLYYYLIKQIVEMSTKWLYQRGDSTKPPPYLKQNAGKLPVFFSSHPEYVNSFLPMIMLEIWENICLESKPVVLSKSQNRFKFSVLSFNKDSDLLKLQCQLVVDNTVSYFPCDKSLVILDFVEVTKVIHSIFGFVTYDKVLQSPNVLHFNVHVKFKPNFFPAAETIMEGNGICSLADRVKLADTFSFLKFSPVLNDILKPNWETFCIQHTKNLSSHDYMSIQNEICRVVVDAMKLPAKKIILLEGPPGSGKTEVISRICEKLVCDEKFCILVAAPSDVSVDEIAGQFIELKDTLSTVNIRFLRLGNPEDICEAVLPYSLHKKLEVIREVWKKRCSDLQSEKDKVRKDTLYHRKIYEITRDSSFGQKLKDLKIKEQELTKMKISVWNEAIEEKEKRKICSNANVILTKLDNFCEIYKYGFKFSCCFIDEINQATEPESLLPFTLKISKFLIIGDRKQLPPVVKSQLAINCRLQRSILERFHLYFHRTYKKSPAMILTNQFRMHREVSYFPLNYFYSINPSKHSFADHRSENWPLKPYIVLDDLSYSDNQSPDRRTGVCTILNMCLYMLRNCSATSIGIIVPSQYEKELYLSALIRENTLSNIEIDTVEAFQGREKSIVVLSCYHESFSEPDSIFTDERRLNVALTRACCSLIICGPVHLINQCPIPYWNKLIANAHQRECYKSFYSPDDISDVFKTYIFKHLHDVK